MSCSLLQLLIYTNPYSNLFLFRAEDCWYNVVTVGDLVYMLGRARDILFSRQGNFSLVRNFQTGFGANPATSSVGSRGFLPGGKVAGA